MSIHKRKEKGTADTCRKIDTEKGAKKQNWDRGRTTTEFIHDCAPFYSIGEGNATRI